MTTILIRHASTKYSTRYLVNGDPKLRLSIDSDGVAACHRLRDSGRLRQPRTWVTSAFARTQQTAVLLAGPMQPQLHVEAGLNEIDYGRFEGGAFLDYAAWLGRHGPCTRPPGAAESQREAFVRMLTAVRSTLRLPGPRAIVAHGLLLSLLVWTLSEPPGEPTPLFFPEAPCLEPLVVADARLRGVTTRLIDSMSANGPHTQPTEGDRPESRRGGMPVLATFDHLRTRPEERPPHA
jgi:probable phosphoglycerate mutase